MLIIAALAHVVTAAPQLDSIAPLKVTVLLEFSAANSEAYALQMQHWHLVQQALGTSMAINYEHVSLQRSLELMQKSGYCAINKMKTPERLNSLLFSNQPINISPSLRLIRMGTTPQSQPIDLNQWLHTSSKLKVGIATGRSYGAALDQLIQQHAAQIYQLSGEDVHVKLWQMLQKGRLDAIVDYSVRIDYLNKMQPSPQPYSVEQILGQPALVEGYFVCNATEHGQQVIAQINKILESAALQQALYQSYQQYFPNHEWASVEPQIRLFYPLAQQTLH
jgi:uncharacterized protein (TIGR02285 family)